MNKQYLTPELIQWVEQQAKDPIWQMGVLASFKKQGYGIMSISPVGLIHIHGSRDTGWAHIISRHSYYSNDFYFGQGALGERSRFQNTGILIYLIGGRSPMMFFCKRILILRSTRMLPSSLSIPAPHPASLTLMEKVKILS